MAKAWRTKWRPSQFHKELREASFQASRSICRSRTTFCGHLAPSWKINRTSQTPPPPKKPTEAVPSSQPQRSPPEDRAPHAAVVGLGVHLLLGPPCAVPLDLPHFRLALEYRHAKTTRNAASASRCGSLLRRRPKPCAGLASTRNRH